MPSQDTSPQTTPNWEVVVLVERSVAATQEREVCMHSQRSMDATGGRVEGAAQEEPVVGQAWRAV